MEEGAAGASTPEAEPAGAVRPLPVVEHPQSATKEATNRAKNHEWIIMSTNPRIKADDFKFITP
jgi:hypothetical protein